MSSSTEKNNAVVTQLLRHIIYDSATNKLLTTIFSLFLISTIFSFEDPFLIVPLLTIFFTSFIYSLISTLIKNFKAHEVIANSSCLRKLFGGRGIHWYEIQITMSIILASTNLYGIHCVGGTKEKFSLIAYSILNSIFFTFDWYLVAAKNTKLYIYEEIKTNTCIKFIFGIINLIQMLCLIKAMFEIWKNNGKFENEAFHLFPLIYIPILGLGFLNAIKITKCFYGKIIIQQKIPSIVQLVVTSYLALAILSFSVTNVFNQHQTQLSKNSNLLSSNETETFKFSALAPIDSPIPLTLLCIAFTLSMLDLYHRARQWRSHKNNNIESSEPLQQHGGVKIM